MIVLYLMTAEPLIVGPVTTPKGSRIALTNREAMADGTNCLTFIALEFLEIILV